MRHIVAIMITLLVAATLDAQTDTTVRPMPPRHWYDTLTITKPKFARVTTKEKLLLSVFSVFALPVAVVAGGLTILSPSLSALAEDSAWHVGIALSTGFSFGRNGTPLLYYPDLRVQLEAAYYFQRDHAFVYRASLLHDFLIVPIHRKKFYWLSAALGTGGATDLYSTSPYIEAWGGVSNPLGIRYLGLFPMHNFGLRLRAGRNFATEKNWYEISLCATSAFGWFE